MRQDVLAGVSVAGLLLPSAIAYAAIAGVAPEHAIVASIVGLGVYAVMGRSRFAMVAPTSSSAAILAALIISMQHQIPRGDLVADAAILAALNASQQDVDDILTKDTQYRLHANTAQFAALLKQINQTNENLKTLQDQIAAVASHVAAAGAVIGAIGKVLTLVPGI